MTGSGVIPPASTINDGTAGSVSTTISFTATCTPTGSTILSGVWSISWTKIANRTFATVTLPDSAITKYIGGCAFIMPVFQPVTLTGSWLASALDFRNQQLDVMFAGCGSMTPGPFEVLNGTLTFSSGGTAVTVP
ncbi:hypothetical protein [Conexibacter sp. JD483]|uniref:hypothetical protein n=2 Tax=Conexibacter TaxID=191494 RepID=UPI00286FDE53|nr:hypothetical protein [Conexibacter sp. JD483]